MRSASWRIVSGSICLYEAPASHDGSIPQHGWLDPADHTNTTQSSSSNVSVHTVHDIADTTTILLGAVVTSIALQHRAHTTTSAVGAALVATASGLPLADPTTSHDSVHDNDVATTADHTLETTQPIPEHIPDNLPTDPVAETNPIPQAPSTISIKPPEMTPQPPPRSSSSSPPAHRPPPLSMVEHAVQVGVVTEERETGMVFEVLHGATQTPEGVGSWQKYLSAANAGGEDDTTFFANNVIASDLFGIPLFDVAVKNTTGVSDAVLPPLSSASTEPRWAYPKALLIQTASEISAAQSTAHFEEQLCEAEKGPLISTREEHLQQVVEEQRQRLDDSNEEIEKLEKLCEKHESRVELAETGLTEERERREWGDENRVALNKANGGLNAELRKALEASSTAKATADSIQYECSQLKRKVQDLTQDHVDNAELQDKVASLTRSFVALQADRTAKLQRIVDLERFLSRRKDLELSARLRSEAGQRKELQSMAMHDNASARQVFAYDASALQHCEHRDRTNLTSQRNLIFSEISERASFLTEYCTIFDAFSAHFSTLTTSATPLEESDIRRTLNEEENTARGDMTTNLVRILSVTYENNVKEIAALKAKVVGLENAVTERDEALEEAELAHRDEMHAAHRHNSEKLKSLESLLLERAAQYREEEASTLRRHERILQDREQAWEDILALKHIQLEKTKTDLLAEYTTLKEESEATADILRDEKSLQKQELIANSGKIKELETSVSELQTEVNMTYLKKEDLTNQLVLLERTTHDIKEDKQRLVTQLEASRHELIEMNKLTILSHTETERGLGLEVQKAQQDVSELQRKLIKNETFFNKAKDNYKATITELEGQIHALSSGNAKLTKTNAVLAQACTTAAEEAGVLQADLLLKNEELSVVRSQHDTATSRLNASEAALQQQLLRAQTFSPTLSYSSCQTDTPPLSPGGLLLSPIAHDVTTTTMGTASPPLESVREERKASLPQRRSSGGNREAVRAALMQENEVLLKRIAALEGAAAAGVKRQNALREHFASNEAMVADPKTHTIGSHVVAVSVGGGVSFDKLSAFLATGLVGDECSELTEVAAMHGGIVKLVGSDVAERTLFLRAEISGTSSITTTEQEAAAETVQFVVCRVLEQFPADVCGLAANVVSSVVGIIEAARVAVLLAYDKKAEEVKALTSQERHLKRRVEKRAEQYAVLQTKIALAHSGIKEGKEKEEAKKDPMRESEVIRAIATLAEKMDECVSSYSQHAEEEGLRKKRKLERERDKERRRKGGERHHARTRSKEKKVRV